MALATLPSGWVHVWLRPLYLWLLNTLIPVVNRLAGANWTPVRLVSAAAITGTYSATAKTLTVTATGQLVIDGVNVAVGDRALLKDQADPKQNGLYTVTVTGAGAAHPVLTRATDAAASADFVDGKSVTVGEGAQAATAWIFTANAPFILDTDNATFARQAKVGISATDPVTLSAAGDIGVSASTSTHAGAGNAGKLAKLDSAGKLDGLAMPASPTAITQTYSTTLTTVPADTSNAITDSTTGAVSTSALAAMSGVDGAGSNAAPLTATKNNIATLAAELALTKADALATKKLVNQLIDILQAAGLAS